MLIFFLFTFIVSIILKYAISEEIFYLFGDIMLGLFIISMFSFFGILFSRSEKYSKNQKIILILHH